MARQLLASTTSVVLLLLAALATVAVHAASPMPYRPGYGIGSWLPEKVVNGMRREAAARSEMLLTSNLDNDIQSMARELKLANAPDIDIDATSLPPPLSDSEFNGVMKKLTKARKNVWDRKLSALDSLIGQIEGQLDGLAKAAKDVDGDGVPKHGEFTTFASGAESAADWTTSVMGHKERSFDSFNIDVHFVENKVSTDARTSTTLASDIARRLTTNTSGIGSESYLLAEAAKRAKEQAETFLADNSAVGTLLLTSFATHRKVLQFDKLNINPDKLWRAWNFYRDANTVADPFTQHGKFMEQIREESERKMGTAEKVHMVSEMFKGSALVGMVHFVQTNETRQTDLAKELREGSHGAAGSKGYQNAAGFEEQTADRHKLEQDASRVIKLASAAKYKVHFSLVSVGYIPKMSPSDVQMAVRQMGKFDPAAFKVPAIVDEEHTSSALAAVQDNMKAVVSATIQSVGDVESNKLKVMDMRTFMTAFTDYAEAAQTADNDRNIGAPIGMNVRDFTKLDVLSALANKYLGMGMKLAVDQSDEANPTTPTTASGASPEDTVTTDTTANPQQQQQQQQQPL